MRLYLGSRIALWQTKHFVRMDGFMDYRLTCEHVRMNERFEHIYFWIGLKLIKFDVVFFWLMYFEIWSDLMPLICADIFTTSIGLESTCIFQYAEDKNFITSWKKHWNFFRIKEKIPNCKHFLEFHFWYACIMCLVCTMHIVHSIFH